MVLEHVNMVVMCQSVTQHFTTARRHILGGGGRGGETYMRVSEIVGGEGGSPGSALEVNGV